MKTPKNTISPSIPDHHQSAILVHCSHAQLVDVTELVANPRNPNKHSDKQVALLAKIIRHQGWRSPITVSNRSGFVVTGHGRLQAAILLGEQLVPVDRQDFASEADEWAHLVADNRIAELADADKSMITDLLKDLDSGGLDMDLTGFDMDALEELLAEENPSEITEDEVPDVPVDPITKLGDLWILGEHRVLCGDSTKAEDVGRLMAGATIGSVITDPPFGMSFVSNYRVVKHKAIAGDSTADLLAYACAIEADHSSYVFCRWDNLSQVPPPTSLITWVKNNWSMGDLEHAHARQTEVALFYRGKNHSFPDGRPTDVVQHPRTGNNLHPTEKPVALLSEIIGWSIGLVFDPFLGSGTTLIAAEQLGRKCYGMEISPAYCDVIVKRWENLTGKKAVLSND